MRICHVSPHLPPDQAANALLPAELAAWAHARGDEVTLVAHEPAQGRAAQDLPFGRVVAAAAQAAGRPPSAGCFEFDTLQQARVIQRRAERGGRATRTSCICTATASSSKSRPRGRTRRGIPYVLTLYGTEIWHYRRRWPIDPFTRAYRRAGAVTFYSRKLMERAVEPGPRSRRPVGRLSDHQRGVRAAGRADARGVARGAGHHRTARRS